jgi:hypothetical protein
MNDDQIMTAVRDSFAQVRLDVPLERTVRRGRALRGRSRRYQLAGVAGVAAVAGVTAAAVTGLGRTSAPTSASSHATTTLGGGQGTPRASAVAGPGGTGTDGTRLDAWTVTKNPNGIVDVTIRQLSDAAGLQAALRADGVPARVAFQPGIPSDTPPLPAGCTMAAMSDEADANLQGKILGMVPMDPMKGIALTIDTRQIPSGVGIYLAVQPGVAENGGTEWGWGLDLVKTAPACTG